MYLMKLCFPVLLSMWYFWEEVSWGGQHDSDDWVPMADDFVTKIVVVSGTVTV